MNCIKCYIFERKIYLKFTPLQAKDSSSLLGYTQCGTKLIVLYGLFRQSLNGTGTGTSIMLIPSHCNGSGTRTGNLRICLHVLNRDPNVPCGFVYIMPGNDITLV